MHVGMCLVKVILKVKMKHGEFNEMEEEFIASKKRIQIRNKC